MFKINIQTQKCKNKMQNFSVPDETKSQPEEANDTQTLKEQETVVTETPPGKSLKVTYHKKKKISSTGTFLHLNAISTVPDRCYPFKVQTSNELNLQDIPFYTLLIFSSAGTFNFSSTGNFDFSSTGNFLYLNAIRILPDRCYPFKVQTSNQSNQQKSKE